MNKQKQEKLQQYKQSLNLILGYALEDGGITLKKLQTTLDESLLQQLIPTVDIFKELMIELLQAKEIDIKAWKQEQMETISLQSFDFVLSTCLLEVINENKTFKQISKMAIYKVLDDEVVTFKNRADESGQLKTINCSNVVIQLWT